MKEHTVDSFNKLNDVLTPYRKDLRWLFRGHSNPSWKLIPKAGREEFASYDDERFFRAWKRRAIEFVSLPYDFDWGWLAIAQHHGLATRLLDWTFNPLAAAFFAVSEGSDSDAVIYAYKKATTIDPDQTKPFEIEGVEKFKPMGVVPRIIRQGGIFTIHGNRTRPLEETMDKTDVLEKIIIARSYRDELVFELSQYGVNKATLFPDLDGLSAYTNWVAINQKYWSASAKIEDKI